MLDFVEKSTDKLGGTPVFQGTRIPVYVLFDYLRDGYTIEDFLEQYDIDSALVYGFLDAWRDDYSPGAHPSGEHTAA